MGNAMKVSIPPGSWFAGILLTGLLFTSIDPASASRSIRFRWRKGDVFSYRLEGTVREGRISTALQGEVTLRALSPEAALLERRVSSLVQREEGSDPRTAAPGDLDSMRILAPIGPRGGVPEEAGLTAEEAKSVRGFVASLFPFPPSGSGPAEDGWEIRIPTQGDLLTGKGRAERTVDVEGFSCIEIRFEASSARTKREVEGIAHFSTDLQAFVRVEREIRSPGPPERTERLSLRLRRHPTGPVLDPVYRKELEIAREATDRDPKNPAAWSRLADVLRSGGSGTEALEAIGRASALDAKEATYRTREGEILGLLGRLDEAKEVLGAVVDADPDRVLPRLHLARILFQQGILEEAAVHAEAVLERDAESVDARFLLGLVRGKQGETEEAVRLIRSCFPVEEGEAPPVVTFDTEGNLRLVIPKAASTPSERPPLTEEEREIATKIIEEIVREEAVRQEMEAEEVDRILEYVAAACGTDPPGMIAEFIGDREATARKIAVSMARKSLIPMDDIRGLLESKDPDLRLGAAFYLPIEEAIAAVRQVIREDPSRPEPYLHLASIILREKGAAVTHRDDLLRALRAGKDLDPENAIYSYLLASIHFDQGQTILGVGEVAEGIQRPGVVTLRAAEARLRRRALTEVGFDPVFRPAVAWADSETPFGGHLQRAADGVIAFAGLVEKEGKAADARSFLESVLLVAAQVRGSAKEVGLVRGTAPFEAAALKTLVELDRRVGDEEGLRIHEGWMEAVRTEEALRQKAEDAFRAGEDEALRLWPITRPAGTRDYLRRAIAGERKIYERLLEEARRASGEGG